MNLPSSKQLNIAQLSRVFDNKSECYKLFWFQAILSKVCQSKRTMSFEELVNEMIADAWYMVSEYHLNLGPMDNLEFAVDYIHETTGIKPTEKKDTILEFLRCTDDRNIKKYKQTLTKNVPYRLQSTFMPELKGADWYGGYNKIAEKINLQPRLMYYFTKINGANSEITIQPEWFDYLEKNQEILSGWIQYNLIKYLQKRNPSVPGISDKLKPPIERNLTKVIKYWKAVFEIQPIHEIYNNEAIDTNNISIDHFVPWSYVAHDEFWNLHPTTKSINSSKSNNLPDWALYFPRLCDMEYSAYMSMWKYEKLHKMFDNCSKEHINSDSIRHRLYRQGHSKETFTDELEGILYPVYSSAKNCGFGQWRYQG